MQAPLIVDGVRNCSSGDSIALFGLPLSRARSLEHAFDLVRELFTAKPARAGLVTFARILSASELQQGTQVIAITSDAWTSSFAMASRWPLPPAALGASQWGKSASTALRWRPNCLNLPRPRDTPSHSSEGAQALPTQAARRLAAEYPGISIIAALDGYRPQRELVSNVSLLGPQIVICGMGAPRQEEFLVALADAGWKGVGFTCGGYFDHLGQGFQFYPALLDRLNLRWLYRIAREPRRIGYRAVIEYGPFWLALAQGLLGRGRPSGGPQRSV